MRYVGELMILWHEGTAKERVERRSLVFDPKTLALAFVLHPSGKITATKVVKPKKEKP